MLAVDIVKPSCGLVIPYLSSDRKLLDLVPFICTVCIKLSILTRSSSQYQTVVTQARHYTNLWTLSSSWSIGSFCSF